MTATKTPPRATAAGDEPALKFGGCRTIEELLLAQPKTARISQALALSVLKDAGLEADMPLTDEQRNRAEVVEQTKAGLVGKARAHWIVTGESGTTPARNGRARTSGLSARAASRTRGGLRGPRDGSTMHSVLLILKAAKQPMSSEEIYEEMKRRGLAGNLKGKTPVATINAQVCVALRERQHRLSRPEKGKYKISK